MFLDLRSTYNYIVSNIHTVKVIDLRSTPDFEDNHIFTSLNIDLDKLEKTKKHSVGNAESSLCSALRKYEGVEKIFSNEDEQIVLISEKNHGLFIVFFIFVFYSIGYCRRHIRIKKFI